MSERIYAIRRADGELIGDYSFLVVPDALDWTPAEDEAEYGEPTDYEMVEMTVEVVARRTLPECRERCGEPARFWGLCEQHAREDDPTHFEEVAP